MPAMSWRGRGRPRPASSGSRRGRMRGILASAAFCALCLAAGAASAEVLEIGDDGTVVRHDRPAQYLSADLTPRPLVAPAVAALSARPRAEVAAAIRDTADQLNLDPRLLEAVAWQESRVPADAVSPKGALGVMQLMPATARALGVDAMDLRANVLGGGVYLQSMLRRYGGDLPLALAAYNAGPGAVERHGGDLLSRNSSLCSRGVAAPRSAASSPTARRRPWKGAFDERSHPSSDIRPATAGAGGSGGRAEHRPGRLGPAARRARVGPGHADGRPRHHRRGHRRGPRRLHDADRPDGMAPRADRDLRRLHDLRRESRSWPGCGALRRSPTSQARRCPSLPPTRCSPPSPGRR